MFSSRYVKTGLGIIFVFLSVNISLAENKESECITCHKEVTPGIVEQHLEGKMSKKGIDCSTCHDKEHNKMDDAKLAKMPTPETCKKCHKKQVEQFNAGKHNLAWTAAVSMPMMAHQPKAVTGEGYKGCSGCHKMGIKSAVEIEQYRYGHAQCDACHTRHSFKKSEASDPRACQSCHMGFDHPQWEMWSTSKHGTIWQIEDKTSKRAPTCQTCHMSNGDHNVITSWGFLALRLPEDDKDWLNDRVVILQALGVLDENGNPTARLELVKGNRLARLTKEEFQQERDKMIKICSKCHSASYAKGQLDACDMVIKDSDKIMAEAVREVKNLYKDGIIKKPEGWTFAPDLLQFYEAKSKIEEELYVMFLEYRMRAFQGAFHMNPDYMHWYGWAPMKESLENIKEEAQQLRVNRPKE
ncbi:MAG: multiheme c-type cytochrome [bacterium]|nr:multiheme c-type cytochrome [bacterium]